MEAQRKISNRNVIYISELDDSVNISKNKEDTKVKIDKISSNSLNKKFRMRKKSTIFLKKFKPEITNSSQKPKEKIWYFADKLK